MNKPRIGGRIVSFLSPLLPLVLLPGVLWQSSEIQAQDAAAASLTAFVFTRQDSASVQLELEESVADMRAALAGEGIGSAEPSDAAVLVEVLSRRTLGGYALVRVEVSAGDEAAEIRGGSGLRRSRYKEASRDATRRILAWLADRPTISARARSGARGETGTARVPEGDQVPLPALLARAADYVDEYQRAFASIVGMESYQQTFRTRAATYQGPVITMRRDLRSEVVFAWFAEAESWFGFRDVLEVDGKPVGDRQQRLASLFFAKPAGKVLKRVINESARYNLGTIRRNFNAPMVPLLFLNREHQGRFQFHLGTIAGKPIPGAVVIRYAEVATPTFIQANGEQNAPSHGWIWMEPETGRVLATELRISDDDTDIRIGVQYRSDDRLGILVPSRMRELYDYPRRIADVIECTASYQNFKRFETETKVHIK